jgi:hypothetical protein
MAIIWIGAMVSGVIGLKLYFYGNKQKEKIKC